MTRPVIAILGGSFDPVHDGHVALASYFVKLFQPDLLRIIPAGNPWQKASLHASAHQRCEMLKLAFADQAIPFIIDPQEIERNSATYTIDTLQSIRAELGPQAAILFLIGADQLQGLHTWRQWQKLFDYTHICAASRPGFAMDLSSLPNEVAGEIQARLSPPDAIRASASGRVYLAEDLQIGISSTEIRAALRQGLRADAPVPPRVLDYIEQQHLYRN